LLHGLTSQAAGNNGYSDAIFGALPAGHRLVAPVTG
jgi:hypothetical protein